MDSGKIDVLQKINCSFGDFKYTFNQQEIRQKRNVTFIVHVYNFEVPITIQISFSRRSRIQLLHFFITFFGCLFSLLVIAFITWKSKQRYDQYRHQRQIIIQMEHMASRPFTKLLLDVTKSAPPHRQQQDMSDFNDNNETKFHQDKINYTAEVNHLDLAMPMTQASSTSKKLSKICKINKKIHLKKCTNNNSMSCIKKEQNNQQFNNSNGSSTNETNLMSSREENTSHSVSATTKVMPVAVEPLSNNKAAVLTCILKLPQGGLNCTPKGSSPLVLASTYVQLNSASTFCKPQTLSNSESIMQDDDDNDDEDDDDDDLNEKPAQTKTENL
jgi:hypothetical protein